MNKLYPFLFFLYLSIPQITAQGSIVNLTPGDFLIAGPDRSSCYSDEAEMLHWNLNAPAAVFGLSGIGMVGLNTQAQAGMFQNPALLTAGEADNEVNLRACLKI